MPRIFPYTEDGDRISMDFDYKEEAEAFQTAIHNLKIMRDTCLRRNEATEQFTVENTKFPYEMRVARMKPGINIFTTLQVKMLRDHKDEVTKILGVHICNVFGRAEVYMSIYTGEAKK